jgi:hypothetical protein
MAIACTSPALATRPILTSEVSTWRIDVTDEGLIFVPELRGGGADSYRWLGYFSKERLTSPAPHSRPPSGSR